VRGSENERLDTDFPRTRSSSVEEGRMEMTGFSRWGVRGTEKECLSLSLAMDFRTEPKKPSLDDDEATGGVPFENLDVLCAFFPGPNGSKLRKERKAELGLGCSMLLELLLGVGSKDDDCKDRRLELFEFRDELEGVRGGPRCIILNRACAGSLGCKATARKWTD
jgi:hypothetical protein